MFSLANISMFKIASLEAPFPEVRIMRLTPVDGKIPPYKPGQFVFLHVIEGGKSVVRRAYSLSSAHSSPYLEFAIQLVGGQFTGRLERMKPGDMLGVEGPAGHMVFTGQKKAAFVGGGTGISPFMGMLRHIEAERIDGEFLLFYSVRTKDRILYREELESLQKKHPGIKIIITLTRETDPSWKGEKGRIDCPMVLRHAKVPADFDWFICGSPALVKAARECLQEAGADPKRIKMEGWSALS
ncbi:MAG: FAD-binding oxidoreductase [Candidatus Micrarchaeota archaeon]